MYEPVLKKSQCQKKSPNSFLASKTWAIHVSLGVSSEVRHTTSRARYDSRYISSSGLAYLQPTAKKVALE